jgi:hypothetical protein
MPRKGFKAITVSDSLYEKIEANAKKRDKSIPEYLEEVTKGGA